MALLGEGIGINWEIVLNRLRAGAQGTPSR
jgi:hypothetical protein